MDSTTGIGIGASVFTAISLLPQLAKIIREKRSEGISYLMLVSLFIGLSLWTWYGLLKSDWIIVISNGFSLAVNMTLAILAVKYKKG